METFFREIVAEAEFGWLCYLEKKIDRWYSTIH